MYRSLPTGTKEQLKQSVRSGEIEIKPNKNFSPMAKTGIIRKILDIYTKVITVDQISHMVR